ncbi:MAG: putative lipid II flippase FtsW [Desulfosarcinaceae bacterium]|nr:putative lipid II flippase FtsW [Desulfosarcinaceae bacterium]
MNAVADAPRATRISGLTYDTKLLFCVLFLVGVGIVMVFSSSSALALKHYDTSYYFLKRQTLFSLLGICALVICSHLPYRLYRLLAYPILLGAIGALLMVQFSSLGVTAGGARRWLDLGFLRFQPSELARMALVIYLAYSLSKKQANIRRLSVGFLPHVVVLGIFTALLLAQPDFGSVVIFTTITWILMFVGGVPLRWLLGFLLPLLPLGYYYMMSAPYRVRRLLSFLDPWQYPADAGYQTIHSLMAFGSGGVVGTGIGKGVQKLFYLPESHTDFIFSVIGEELGLVGVWIIIALYTVLFWRGVRIARGCDDLFGALLAMGITTAIGLQVVINMGVTLGLLPTKGLTLPFLSYGGTSLLLNMGAIGILMNIGMARHRGGGDRVHRG